jgi:outer membrane protein OmpA-like peptidoglycan-associated protein
MQFKFALTAAAVSLAMLMQGCAGTKVTADGKTTQPVFPKQSSAWMTEGTFPNVDSLRDVRPGMTKDQLYASLGRPHFGEGLFGVREWNYIFNFRTGNGNEYVTCQYQVLFDKDSKAQSFYWAPESCASMLAKQEPARAAAPVAAVAAPAVLRSVTLSGDALFAFNRSDVGGLTAAGRSQLTELAHGVSKMDQVTGVEIAAFADRLGSAPYNQRLSQARAETIRSLFAKEGVSAEMVQAQGFGSSRPVVQCNNKNHDALVKCLAPNRRVEIQVLGKAKS